MAQSDKKISEFTDAIAADISDLTIIPAITLDGSQGYKNVKASLGQILKDATSSAKGRIQLTGDLGGTAESPTVPGLGDKAPIANPTFTGTVSVPDAVSGDSSNIAANTRFVTEALSNVSAGDTPDATNIIKGKLQISQDLSGTADAPTVVGLNGVAIDFSNLTNNSYLNYNGTSYEFSPLTKVITETISSQIEIPLAKEYTLELKAPVAFKVDAITIKSVIGGGEYWLAVDGVPVQGGIKDASNYTGIVTTTESTITFTGTAKEVAIGQDLVLEFASIVENTTDIILTVQTSRII
jgi:hypothetical protein